MRFDFARVSAADRYKLLSGLVVPRPIALITSIDADGVVNAAPFSFFNVFAEDPAIVVVGLETRADGRLKHTTQNIRRAGTFVINLVDEPLAQAMNDCAITFPDGTSEPAALGLACVPSTHVPVPRLAAAPVALECRQVTIMTFGAARDLVIGEVLGLDVRDGIVDPVTLRTDFEALAPIGRLAGALYARQRDRFTLATESYEAWAARKNIPS